MAKHLDKFTSPFQESRIPFLLAELLTNGQGEMVDLVCRFANPAAGELLGADPAALKNARLLRRCPTLSLEPLRPLQQVLGLESAEAAQALVLSWVGGYAVCARLAGQLYDAGRISRRDAVRLQILGCCSGPGFVIGCVGGLLLGNVRLGVVLYAAQIGANLAAGVVCLFGACGRTCGDAPDLRDGCGGRCASPPRGRMQASAPTVQQVSISSAITSAVTSSLSVCGCVVFFRLVGAVLGAVIPLPSVLVSAALEVSAGCADFAVLGGQAALYGCCAVLSLLGVSVWAQMQLFAGAAFCPQVLHASRLLHLVFLQGSLLLLPQIQL